jgi:hypothetical protein
MDILICIAFHYAETRLQYLKKILSRFLNTYNCPFHIIIDTNTTETEVLLRELFPLQIDSNIIEISVHETLPHPHSLTWAHRFHFKENLEKYQTFMYLEDDMDLPYENFVNYLENFNMMWPHFVPSFVRVESDASGELFSSDHLLVHKLQRSQLAQAGSKRFMRLHMDYNALWIMPRDALILTIKDWFARWEVNGFIRETAASYILWELKVPGLYEVSSDGKISEKCYVYHLPNNYVNAEGTPLGKMSLKNLVQII